MLSLVPPNSILSLSHTTCLTQWSKGNATDAIISRCSHFEANASDETKERIRERERISLFLKTVAHIKRMTFLIHFNYFERAAAIYPMVNEWIIYSLKMWNTETNFNHNVNRLNKYQHRKNQQKWCETKQLDLMSIDLCAYRLFVSHAPTHSDSIYFKVDSVWQCNLILNHFNWFGSQTMPWVRRHMPTN